MSTKEWPISYWHYVPGPSSPMQMMRGAMKVMDCGGVKPDETVLISTDTNKMRIAEALGGAAYAVGATPIIIMIACSRSFGSRNDIGPNNAPSRASEAVPAAPHARLQAASALSPRTASQKSDWAR